MPNESQVREVHPTGHTSLYHAVLDGLDGHPGLFAGHCQSPPSTVTPRTVRPSSRSLRSRITYYSLVT